MPERGRSRILTHAVVSQAGNNPTFVDKAIYWGQALASYWELQT